MLCLLPLLAAVLLPTAVAAAPEGHAAAMLPGRTGLIEWLAVLPLALPLLGAALTLAFRGRRDAQRWITLAALALTATAATALAIMVAERGMVVTVAGNWLPPFGIAIVVDPLGALFVLTSAVLGLALLGAVGSDEGNEGDVAHGFYTFYCLLIAGVCGAFATGDLFNLYVWFEVFLVASFGLMVVGGRGPQLDAAIKYGVLNLLATTIVLVAVAALYGVTGTLNMADLRAVLAGRPQGPLVTIGALFVMAFAMKAAAFPLHAWLPASYHAPRTVAAALFAGLLTKIGVYGLIRILMVYGEAGAVLVAPIFWVGVATAILAALAAIAQTDLKRLAAFLVVSGVGVMLVGIGLGAPGLPGTLVYAIHSMVAMSGLFLAIGLVERLAGAASLDVATGFVATRPLVAALFFVFGFAAAGLPPLSGFWPKLMLMEVSIERGGLVGASGAVAIVASGFLTTVAVGRAWTLTYLRPADAAPTQAPIIQTGPVVLLAAFVVALGLAPRPLIEAAQTAAAGVLDPAEIGASLLGGR